GTSCKFKKRPAETRAANAPEWPFPRVRGESAAFREATESAIRQLKRRRPIIAHCRAARRKLLSPQQPPGPTHIGSAARELEHGGGLRAAVRALLAASTSFVRVHAGTASRDPSTRS